MNELPLIVANLGNTNLRLALFQGASILSDRRIQTSELPHGLPDLPAGAGVVLVSVVPSVAEVLRDRWCDRPLLFASAACNTELTINYRPPESLGADRLCNAVAMHHRFGGGIAVDCGTATTLTVVYGGVLLGGTIMPGLGTARASLFKETAQLPEVPLSAPETAWADETIGAIQSGIVHGHVGAVLHLVERVRRELPELPVCLTGGYSRLLAPLLPDDFHLAPDLTLEGARRLWELNEADLTQCE